MSEPNTKLTQLIQAAGLSPSPALFALCASVVQACAKCCSDVGDDLENGNIFITESLLESEIKAGHIGSACWYAARQIEAQFELPSLKLQQTSTSG